MPYRERNNPSSAHTSQEVKPLLPVEIWRIQGGCLKEWEALLADGAHPVELLRGAARALPSSTADKI